MKEDLISYDEKKKMKLGLPNDNKPQLTIKNKNDIGLTSNNTFNMSTNNDNANLIWYQYS